MLLQSAKVPDANAYPDYPGDVILQHIDAFIENKLKGGPPERVTIGEDWWVLLYRHILTNISK
jgi:hypothetical protein